MAPPSYRTYGSSGSGRYSPGVYSSSAYDPGASIWDELRDGLWGLSRRIWRYGQSQGRRSASGLAIRGGQQLRRNMVRRRLLSFPHLLVGVWLLILLWGERWTFANKVQNCDWDHWEDWPKGATPHRLIFIADPQIIDAYSYPGRPWPLNPLVMRLTDNYMRRSYTQLQKVLHPDTVMFLGDLFDGGREWKTAQGVFEDPEWAKDHRPVEQQRLLQQWHKRNGENYWLKEYARFGHIFFDNWIWGGTIPGPFQRGRKIIPSLPGNHDLGFGAEVKLPVRHRFNAFVGETNRVDIIGNHTFVSVDTVSLSADTSEMKDQIDLHEIYQPVHEFLSDIKATKRRALQKELRFWNDEVEEVVFEHRVDDLDKADYSNLPTLDPGENGPDLPTILLSHVPLYRNPGTPCGSMRDHWPPTKPPKGQTEPVSPDPRNAILVEGGYQYQNVLSEEDSIMLVKTVGNVIHVFSGDDHDYCEIVHSPAKDNVREITVKSFSMAMGVPNPGFQMVSLYNPVDSQGKPLAGSPKSTMQTHLCLLPNQLSMFSTYATAALLSVLLLIARAFLVPILSLQPFALEPMNNLPSAVLPVFKAKSDFDDESEFDRDSTSSATSASNLPSARFPSTRTRGQSLPQGLGAQTHNTPLRYHNKAGAGKWGWTQNKGPRIHIRKDTYYDEKAQGNPWKPASRQRTRFGLVATEMWTTCWRVTWMVVLFYAYLMYKG
ncbi:hypothetical protein GGR50DRAFT_52852 [Xylaria sp. CBS 124048]|nr:hypothetical protein GGR50DRAFT_52852 [Xylaria sp. CBS 124048]